MEWVVRPPVVAYAVEIANIYLESVNRVYADPAPRRSPDVSEIARWRNELISFAGRWWVAERDGHMVGFARTRPAACNGQSPDVDLDLIAVADDEWRSGVGRMLASITMEAMDIPSGDD